METGALLSPSACASWIGKRLYGDLGTNQGTDFESVVPFPAEVAKVVQNHWMCIGQFKRFSPSVDRTVLTPTYNGTL